MNQRKIQGCINRLKDKKKQASLPQIEKSTSYTFKQIGLVKGLDEAINMLEMLKESIDK